MEQAHSVAAACGGRQAVKNTRLSRHARRHAMSVNQPLGEGLVRWGSLGQIKLVEGPADPFVHQTPEEVSSPEVRDKGEDLRLNRQALQEQRDHSELHEQLISGTALGHLDAELVRRVGGPVSPIIPGAVQGLSDLIQVRSGCDHPRHFGNRQRRHGSGDSQRRGWVWLVHVSKIGHEASLGPRDVLGGGRLGFRREAHIREVFLVLIVRLSRRGLLRTSPFDIPF